MPFTVRGNHRDLRRGVPIVRHYDDEDARIHHQLPDLCDAVVGVHPPRPGGRAWCQLFRWASDLEELAAAVMPGNYRGRFFAQRAAAAFLA